MRATHNKQFSILEVAHAGLGWGYEANAQGSQQNVQRRSKLMESQQVHQGISLAVMKHLTNCSCRESILETLLALLGDGHTISASLWRERCHDSVKSLGRSTPISLIESVFDTQSPNFVSRCSVEGDNLHFQSILVLPIFENKTLVAVLNLERSGLFEDTEFEDLLSLTDALGSLLGTLPDTRRVVGKFQS
jgi:hypothetical protein